MKIILIAFLTMVLQGIVLAGSLSHSPVDELQTAYDELSDLQIRYTDQHPKVLAKRQEITMLEKRLGIGKSVILPKPAVLHQDAQTMTRYSQQLEKALGELNDLQIRYTDQHPKVLAKRKEIAALKKKMVSN